MPEGHITMSKSPDLNPTTTNRPSVGIIGAGRAGTAIARTLLQAGIDTQLCSTRPPRALRHHLKIYAPGSTAVDCEEIAEQTILNGPGVVVLAVPQEELDEVDPDWAGACVLIDATNSWHDELLPGWLQAATDELVSTSVAIASRFPHAKVVKALNTISHHELVDAAAPDSPMSGRRAMPLVADDDHARAVVMGLLVRMGFDPVSLGRLPVGKLMQPEGILFHRAMQRDEMLRLVG